MTLSVIAWISFFSLGMLGWAAAAIIPVVIHLLRRRRKVAVSWAAMHLLREIVAQESQRVNLQQILLLLLRVAILLIFALALSRPYWNRQNDGSTLISSRPSKLWIFVLDTSYSMGYRTGELTRTERAKQQAASMVRESQPGDAFALIALDQPARAIVNDPTFDSQSILKEIQNLTDNARGCDPLSALSLASQITSTARSNPQMPQDVEIVLLTDLGEDAWQTANGEAVESSLIRLHQSAKVTVEPIVDSQPTNVAVEQVQPMTKRLVVGRPFTVEVSIASYGQSMKEMPVDLVWNEQILATDNVDVDAGGLTKILMTITPQRPGPGVLSVITPTDNLPIDNRFDLVLKIRPHFRVLIIDSKTDSLNPWLLALQPDPQQSDLGVQGEVRVLSELQWQSSQDTDWDVIIVNDPSFNRFGPLDRLKRYVDSGGCLIVTLGKNLATIESNGNAITTDKKSEIEKLLGYRLLRPSDVSDWTIDPLDYQSPVVKVFEGFPNAGLLTTPLARFWEVEQQDPTLSIDLAVTTGQPLIVHRRQGSGYVVSLLSAPEDGRGIEGDASWNAMTAWPSFLPLAQQMAQVFFDNNLQSSNKMAGQQLVGQLRILPTIQQVNLIRPDGTETQLTCQKSDDSSQVTWTYEDTDQRGVYQVTESESGRQRLAVNIDPVQSSLRSRAVASLPTLASSASTVSVTGEPSPLSVTSHWSFLLLITLSGLLVAESLAAWALGRQTG